MCQCAGVWPCTALWLVVETGSWDSGGPCRAAGSVTRPPLFTPSSARQTGPSCQGSTDPLPLLEPKLLKLLQLIGATVFPVTPEGEGMRPTEAGMCLCPLGPDLLLTCSPREPGCYLRRVFLQPQKGLAASPTPPPAAQNLPPPRLHSFLGSSPLHLSHFIQEALT